MDSSIKLLWWYFTVWSLSYTSAWAGFVEEKFELSCYFRWYPIHKYAIKRSYFVVLLKSYFDVKQAGLGSI